jgi:glycosyltransferase involved in cell wall biosynthesis/Tfp pilus assembly protein PilF
MSDKLKFPRRKANEKQDPRDVSRSGSEIFNKMDKPSFNQSIRSAYSIGDFEAALELSVGAIKSFPNEPEFLLFKARSLNQMGEKNNANKVYERLTVSHPEVQEPYIMLARARYSEGNYGGVIDKINEWPGASDEQVPMLILKARSLQALALDDEALHEWAKIAALDPENVEAQFRMGQIDYNSRRYENARERLEATLQIDPEYRAARRLIGLCYDALGETGIASEWLLKEAISDPHLYSNWLKIVDVLLKEGNEEACRDLIERIPEYVGENHKSVWFPFLLSKSIGWSERSDELWHSVLEKVPINVETLGEVVEDLLDLGEIRLALEAIDAAEEHGIDTSTVLPAVQEISNITGYGLEDIREEENLLTTEMALDAIVRKCSGFRIKKPSKWPISVLHISSSMGQGGAERQLLALAKAQVKDPRFSKVMLLTYANQDIETTYLREAEIAGVELHFYSDPLNHTSEFTESKESIPESLTKLLPSRFVRDLNPMTRAIDALRPGVVHLWQDETNIIGGIACLWNRTPAAIMSCRSMRPDGKTMLHIRNRPYLLRAYKALLKDLRFNLIVNSEAGAKSYSDWIGIDEKRASVIRNGYDFKSFKPDDPEIVSTYLKENDVPDDALIVGSVFRFVPEKRIDLWIKVARKVISESEDTYFIAVGHGSGLEEAKSLVRGHGLEHRILFPGRTKDVPSWLGAFDVFLLTSRIEGLPNVLIEAQSAGVPVVSTVAGGSPETFIDGITGYLSASDDPDDLAKAVSLILQDSKWRHYAASESSDFVRENFDIDMMADNYAKAYSHLLDDSHKRWMESRTLMDRLLMRS